MCAVRCRLIDSLVQVACHIKISTLKGLRDEGIVPLMVPIIVLIWGIIVGIAGTTQAFINVCAEH